MRVLEEGRDKEKGCRQKQEVSPHLNLRRFQQQGWWEVFWGWVMLPEWGGGDCGTARNVQVEPFAGVTGLTDLFYSQRVKLLLVTKADCLFQNKVTLIFRRADFSTAVKHHVPLSFQSVRENGITSEWSQILLHVLKGRSGMFVLHFHDGGWLGRK